MFGHKRRGENLTYQFDLAQSFNQQKVQNDIKVPAWRIWSFVFLRPHSHKTGQKSIHPPRQSGLRMPQGPHCIMGNSQMKIQIICLFLKRVFLEELFFPTNSSLLPGNGVIHLPPLCGPWDISLWTVEKEPWLKSKVPPK